MKIVMRGLCPVRVLRICLMSAPWFPFSPLILLLDVAFLESDLL